MAGVGEGDAQDCDSGGCWDPGPLLGSWASPSLTCQALDPGSCTAPGALWSLHFLFPGPRQPCLRHV